MVALAKVEKWKPGCGWGASSTSATQDAAEFSDFWHDVLDGKVTQRPFPDESVTVRCENGQWQGKSFRLYPPETELDLGVVTYAVSPPTEGVAKKGSVDPRFAWHLVVRGG